MEQSHRHTIEDRIDEARTALQAAEDHLQKLHYSAAIGAAQRCIEQAVTASLDVLGITYARKQEWTTKALAKIAAQLHKKHLWERVPEPHLNQSTLPRVLMLAKLWGTLYLPAQYGLEGGDVAAARDLFKAPEAKLAVEHAHECYNVAYWIRGLSEEQLAALLTSPT